MRKPRPLPAKPRPPGAKPRPTAVRPPPPTVRPPPPSAAPVPPPPPAGRGAPWLWGRHAVLAALVNPARKVQRLVATEEAAAELTKVAAASEVPAPHIVTKDELDRLLPREAVHQGMALLAKPLRPPAIEDVIEAAGRNDQSIVIALDQVTDPHNVGAVLRSAAAFGALAVLLPERNAPEITGTLAKSASGAIEHVSLLRVINLARSLAQLKEAGFWVVGLAGDAERTLASHHLTGRVVLVLGSEGDGMRRLTREACDLMAKLPTAGPIASLNVSNAAAIALYELRRDG